MKHAKSVVVAFALSAVVLSAVAIADASILQLAYDNGQHFYTSQLRQAGDRVGAVFQPDEALYPVTIVSIDTTVGTFAGADASVEVKGYIYTAEDTDGDGELEPGTVIAESNPFTITTFYPNWHAITFDEPVIVTGPFFAAIEYLSGRSGKTPSIPLDTQQNILHGIVYYYVFDDFWEFYPEKVWIEHYDFWHNADHAGYSMIRVTISSETEVTPTVTGSSQPPVTPSSTPTASYTPIATPISTPTATDTATATPTQGGQPPTVTLTATPSGSVTATATTGVTPTPTLTMSACEVDFDDDGGVGSSDVQVAASHWHESVNPTSPFDVNQDGRVNIADIMLVVRYVGQTCPLATATPTATSTPPPPPAGRFRLTVRVFLDYRCDAAFRSGLDVALTGVPVTLTFTNGAAITGQTNIAGLVYFTNFDVPDEVTVAVQLPGSYHERALGVCTGSAERFTLTASDFGIFKTASVSFRARIRGEVVGP